MNKADLKPFAASGQNLALVVGNWVNELGSTMEIVSQDQNGLISGVYTSAVSGSGQPVKGALTGFVNDDTIGWSVNWAPTFNTVTSWTGELLSDGGAPVIYALWNLAQDLQDNEADWWESFLAGADFFVLQP